MFVFVGGGLLEGKAEHGRQIATGVAWQGNVERVSVEAGLQRGVRMRGKPSVCDFFTKFFNDQGVVRGPVEDGEVDGVAFAGGEPGEVSLERCVGGVSFELGEAGFLVGFAFEGFCGGGAGEVEGDGLGTVDGVAVELKPVPDLFEHGDGFCRKGAVWFGSDIEQEGAVFTDHLQELLDDVAGGFPGVVSLGESPSPVKGHTGFPVIPWAVRGDFAIGVGEVIGAETLEHVEVLWADLVHLVAIEGNAAVDQGAGTDFAHDLGEGLGEGRVHAAGSVIPKDIGLVLGEDFFDLGQ